MANKKKKAVPKSCQMAASMTHAAYMNAVFSMFDGNEHYFILVRDIIAIIVFDEYVLFRMNAGADIHQKHNIGYYKDLLSCTQFGKYGKSCILNKHFVMRLGDGSEIVAYMFNGDIYKVSEDNNVRVRQDMKPIFAARIRKLKNIVLCFLR